MAPGLSPAALAARVARVCGLPFPLLAAASYTWRVVRCREVRVILGHVWGWGEGLGLQGGSHGGDAWEGLWGWGGHTV